MYMEKLLHNVFADEYVVCNAIIYKDILGVLNIDLNRFLVPSSHLQWHPASGGQKADDPPAQTTRASRSCPWASAFLKNNRNS